MVGMAGLPESRLPTNDNMRGLPCPTEVVLTVGVVNRLSAADLEKAASGASGACGHFVRNYAILRTF